MSALSNIYSSSNFTLSGQSSPADARFCLYSQTAPQLTGLNLNFTPSFLANGDSSNRMLNGSQLNFNFAVPGDLQLTTGTVFQKTISAQPAPSDRIHVDEAADQTLLSPLVLSGAEVIADFSGHIRQLFSSSKTIYGTENPAALAALGFTTGFSLVSGSLNVRNGIREAGKADKISDTAGKTMAHLKIARGGAFATAGAIFIPARALSIAALSTTAKIVSTMAGVLSTMGSALFSIGSVFAGISIGIRLNEHRQFRSALSAVLNDPNISEQLRSAAALEHLKKLASVSPEEKAAIARELESDPAHRCLTPESQAEKVTEKEKLLLQKKEAFLNRVIGDECLKLIRQKGASESSEVITAVQKKSLEKVVLASIAMALVSIGVAMSIASFIFTGPVGIIVTTVIGLATSFGWLLVDGYGLVREFNSSDPGRFDKLWIFLSTIIAAIAVGIVFFMSGGIAPIIAASVVGAVWLGINLACYYRLYQIEKKKSLSSILN